MRFERGTLREANQFRHRGWVIGHMVEGLGETKGLEVKLWRYEGEIDYPPKTFEGIEFIAVFGGEILLELRKDGDRRLAVLTASDAGAGGAEYIILEPGVTKVVNVVQAPAYGVTVRWPSRSGMNQAG